jgi:DNA-binding HxlR family transcriptional regulator
MEVLLMLTKEEVLPKCPVATTISLIGNKWKLLIIRNLLNGKSRFKDLKDGIDGISKKVLTDNLKSLVDDGIIIRTAYNEIPPRVEYELSDLGNSLRPIIESMKIWGEKYKKMKS